MPLRFLHLSDIHFHKYSQRQELWDLDSDLRHELEEDLRLFCDSNGKIDAVLIGGDVAYSGKSEEYDVASDWLKKVCEIIQCKEENVLTVPGNHDVDWSKHSHFLSGGHEKIRAVKSRHECNELFRNISESQVDWEMFLKPFENYHVFAAKYGSTPIDSNKFFWEQCFDLHPVIVKIKGVNSALISSRIDDDKTNKLALCSPQTQIKREANVVNIFMCHHPIDWLFFGNEIEKELVARSHIQLFGHIHEERIKMVDNSLIMAAGAMQPERNIGAWSPCYNIFELDVSITDTVDLLNVKVWKRKFDGLEKMKFIPVFDEKGSGFRVFSLKLEKVEKQKVVKQNSITETPVDNQTTSNHQNEIIDVNKENNLRKLAYGFLGLPYHKRLVIAINLDLSKESDEQLSDIKKFQLYFQRAKEKNVLKQLWNEVSQVDSNFPTTNPF